MKHMLFGSTHDMSSSAKSVDDIYAWLYNDETIFVIRYDGIDHVIRLNWEQLDALAWLAPKLLQKQHEVSEARELWAEMQTWLSDDGT